MYEDADFFFRDCESVTPPAVSRDQRPEITQCSAPEKTARLWNHGGGQKRSRLHGWRVEMPSIPPKRRTGALQNLLWWF